MLGRAAAGPCGDEVNVQDPTARLAGLSTQALARLTFSDTSALVEQILATQSWLAAEGEGIADRLYEVIGRSAGDPRKPRLVGLRRAVHHNRLPAASEWTHDVRTALPPQLSGRLERWLTQLRECRGARERLATVLSRETQAREADLREIASDPGFRRALSQSSPSLSAELHKWLVDIKQRPRRQTIIRLAKYVSRAAAKTSPSSTFAVSGMATWSCSGAAFDVDGGAPWRGTLELYGPLRDRLIHALVHHPALRDAAEVRPNPSLRRLGGQVAFLGRPPAEPVLMMPVTPAVRECLEHLGVDAAQTLGDLTERLVQTSAAPRAKVAGFLAHLVGAGLLQLKPGTTHDPPSVAQLAAWARKHGGDAVANVAGLLDVLAEHVSAAVALTHLDDDQARHTVIGQTVEQLSEELDLAPNLGVESRSAVHESVVADGYLGRCNRTHWSTVLRDLDVVRRWLAVLNPALPLQLALGELWRERLETTARVPFLALHRAVLEEAATPTPRGRELRQLLSRGWVGAPPEHSAFVRLGQLRRLRREALEFVQYSTDQHSDQLSTDPLHVDPSVLARLVDRWPSWVTPVGSLTCYVQPRWHEGEFGIVLNRAESGYGRGRSRLLYLMQLAGCRVPLASQPVAKRNGQLLAELAGPNGSTVNDRMPSLPAEIDYPFTSSNRPKAERIPLSELLVEFDDARGLLRLRSARSGAELRVPDLGLLNLTKLPPAARLLVQAFGGMSAVYLRASPDSPPAPPTVRRRPRAMVGRVVVSRASWLLDPAGFPNRASGESDADYLLRVNQWRLEAGVPARCFVRALPAPDARLSIALTGKSHKPLYVDFDSWFLVSVLENAARAPAVARLIFEEALPDPMLAAQPDTDPRVAEILLQIDSPED